MLMPNLKTNTKWTLPCTLIEKTISEAWLIRPFSIGCREMSKNTQSPCRGGNHSCQLLMQRRHLFKGLEFSVMSKWGQHVISSLWIKWMALAEQDNWRPIQLHMDTFDSFAVFKDGRHESSWKVKPKHFDYPLVHGCSMGHKSSTWTGQTKDSNKWYLSTNQFTSARWQLHFSPCTSICTAQTTVNGPELVQEKNQSPSGPNTMILLGRLEKMADYFKALMTALTSIIYWDCSFPL